MYIIEKTFKDPKMYIIPAIDLRDGKCVRLIQGQYDRQINYSDHPAEQARQRPIWKRSG